MKGKLIVLEGTDGSGKSTQFARLCRRMEAEGYSFQRLVFPQYQEPSSALIKMYLAGEFGSRPGDVNPYAATAFFAVDRYASWKKVWERWYSSGGLVLADRYTTSNAVHQAAKMDPAQREGFFQWLGELEYGKLGLPEPDLVIWLDMPTDQAVANLRHRESETHTHADIHEVDAGYLAQCREAAQAAAEFYGWRRIACVDTEGKLRGVEELHQEIWAVLKPVITT